MFKNRLSNWKLIWVSQETSIGYLLCFYRAATVSEDGEPLEGYHVNCTLSHFLKKITLFVVKISFVK